MTTSPGREALTEAASSRWHDGVTVGAVLTPHVADAMAGGGGEARYG